MTSDDTKVDTSDWIAQDRPYSSSDTVYLIRDTEVDDVVGDFPKAEHRDACLLAIQSLPKVTAERDAEKERSDKHYALACENQDLYLKASNQVSALSARVRELTEALQAILGATPAERNDPATWFPRIDRARALIGKEPS